MRLAQEGGYDPDWNVTKIMEFPELLDRALLDPEFWKALGRQQGWELMQGIHESEGRHFNCRCCEEEWKYHKARALAANDDGGSAEDYLSSIIK